MRASMHIQGGAAFKAYLTGLSMGVEGVTKVRVGFLEDATYPAGDGGARLAKAAKRAQSDHPEWVSRLLAWSSWQKKHQPIVNVAQVAFWNEFGTVTMKARPFFRNTVKAHSNEWGKQLGTLLVDTHYNAASALRKLALVIKDQLVDAIRSWPADNKPLTSFIKEFNHGLVDRGVMQRAVDYEVTQT